MYVYIYCMCVYMHVYTCTYLFNIAEEYFSSPKVKIQIHGCIPNRFPPEPWGSCHPPVYAGSIALPALPSNGTSITQMPKVPLWWLELITIHSFKTQTFQRESLHLETSLGQTSVSSVRLPTTQRHPLGLPVGCLCVAYSADGVLNSVGIEIRSKKYHAVELLQ